MHLTVVLVYSNIIIIYRSFKATNETKHVFLNETDGVLKNILNGPLEDNLLTGAHHIIFDITNLKENTFYKLKVQLRDLLFFFSFPNYFRFFTQISFILKKKLLGSSSQTVHSLSDLIIFRTLDRPKLILTSNTTNSLSVTIQAECGYHVNKKSDQSAGSSSHGSICSMLIIKWKQFGVNCFNLMLGMKTKEYFLT